MGRQGKYLMVPDAPWIEVPDDWLDNKRSVNPEIARIQEFQGRNVKEEIIRKHLLAEGIGKPGELEIVSIKTKSSNTECSVEAVLHVVGMAWKVEDNNNPGLFVENKEAEIIKECDIGIKRVIKKDKEGTINSAHFSYIDVGTARLPENFGDEYYLRAIPLLQKIGVKSLSIKASTEADDPTLERGRLSGAYAWPKYGYTNGVINVETGIVEEKIDITIDEFLRYLQEDRKIALTYKETSEIKSWSRMTKIADHKMIRDGEKLTVGKDFLLGDDGAGNYSRDILWQGVIPDISDKKSKGMEELVEKLYKYR
jgi:hypothetical protein